MTDINQLVHYLIRDNLEMLKKRDQMLIFTPAEKKVEACVDGETVRTVVENLLDNASKYTEEGGRIKVSIVARANTVTVSVADEGVGVPADRRDDLFKKFSRIDNSLSTKVGGTGLGLYWAKQIMDTHGGTILYHANHPKGSIFEVMLPKNSAWCENSHRHTKKD